MKIFAYCISFSVGFLTVIVVGFASAPASNSGTNDSYTLSSPGGLLTAKIDLAPEQTLPTYSISFRGEPIILPSQMGYAAASRSNENRIVTLKGQGTVDETWKPVWGQSSHVRDHYNFVRLEITGAKKNDPQLEIEMRAYDDGIAFRYRLPAKVRVDDFHDAAEFIFAEDMSLRSYIPERPPLVEESLARLPQSALLPPIVLRPHEDGPVVVLQEAALETGSPIVFENKKSEPALRLDKAQRGSVGEWSAWRVIQVSDNIDPLLTSDLLINLAPETRIEDTSWIKPGKSLWDWRVRGAEYGDFTYDLNNESLRRFVDFAARNGVSYVMVDANWYGPEHEETSDPFTPIEGLDMQAIIAAAREKGVGFILYLNDKADAQYNLDDLFATYEAWGAAGVKYGFLRGSPSEKVEKTLNIVRTAAKHKLLVNFHDTPIPPSGLRRTWPNWITREYAHAQTDAGRTFTPTTFLRQINLNMLAGPLDMSNGFYQLNGLKEARNYVRQDVNSTVAGENARALITFSGLIILPDAPEEYTRKADLFEFLYNMPASWDETQILSNVIDDHIVMARRNGDAWFLGAAANEDGGTVSISLGFLAPDQLYDMTIYSDTEDTHYRSNREAYRIVKKQVRRGDEIEIFMAPGGGQAIWLRPATEDNK